MCAQIRVPRKRTNDGAHLEPHDERRALVPVWRRARDASGATYYWHVVTREARWTDPRVDVARDIGECDRRYRAVVHELALVHRRRAVVRPRA